MVVVNPWTWGLGRRKSAVARVRIKPGSGAFVVNGKPLDEFFVTTQTRTAAVGPLAVQEGGGATLDIFCNVRGGGPSGQSEAISLGLARALKRSNPGLDDALREKRLLTRDARMKERKKYGRRGARRGFQFSKR
jgi:small subunit ribosomal protein S9